METEFFEFDQDEAELWGFGEGDGIPSCTPKSVVDEAFACIEGAKVSINPERPANPVVSNWIALPHETADGVRKRSRQAIIAGAAAPSMHQFIVGTPDSADRPRRLPFFNTPPVHSPLHLGGSGGGSGGSGGSSDEATRLAQSLAVGGWDGPTLTSSASTDSGSPSIRVSLRGLPLSSPMLPSSSLPSVDSWHLRSPRTAIAIPSPSMGPRPSSIAIPSPGGARRMSFPPRR